MTAEQLLTADLPSAAEPPPGQSRALGLIRSSFAPLESRTEELAKVFYGRLFAAAPETRAMFPVHMQVQRSRLLRALVHVVQLAEQPGELQPFLEQLGRDHRKFGVLGEHYDAVGAALVGALAELSGPAWTEEAQRAWTDGFATIAEAMRGAAAAEHGPACWTGTVTGHRRIGWDIAVVTVRTDQPVPYRAGQYLSVETPQRPRLWRYLSPATAPRPDGHLEFHVRAVRGGWVSQAVVAHTRVGDTWRIGPPMGRMQVPPNTERQLLMIAGGTGWAPMRALIDELARRPRQPATHVFVGGRTWDDLYDVGELRELSYRYPWLDVVPVVERDGEPPPGAEGAERGTLADVVTRYGAWADHDVLVCGSPSMIRSTVSRMLVAGTPLDRIRYDPFTVD